MAIGRRLDIARRAGDKFGIWRWGGSAWVAWPLRQVVWRGEVGGCNVGAYSGGTIGVASGPVKSSLLQSHPNSELLIPYIFCIKVAP